MKPKPKTNFERRVFTTATEVRAVDGPNGPMLQGYAAKFGTRSQDLGGFIETIRKGTFAASIEEADVRALVDHDPSKIIGRNKAGTLRLEEDDTGLGFEIDPAETQVGRDIQISVKRGDVTGCSFGFITVEDEWRTEEGFALRELIKVHLFDVSVVTFPAYEDTDVALRSFEAYRSSLKIETPHRDELARWLIVNEVR